METVMEKENLKRNETQIATFFIDKELFGIGIHRIKEIVRYPEITKVPRAAKYLKGLTNLRGNVLPVIDSRIRLGLPVSDITDRSRVLVLDINNSLVGVIVDSVKGVASLEDVRVEVPPAILSSGVDGKFIQNVIHSEKNDTIIMELDISTLCDFEAQKIESQKISKTIDTAETSKKVISEEKQLVTFLIGQEEYGLIIQSVREILRVSRITEVPEAPKYVLGVLSVRNKLLPIIDIRKLFSLPSLAENRLDEIRKIEESYKTWLKAFQFSLDSESISARDIKKLQTLNWIESIRTSSEVIGKLLQKLRFLHQDLIYHSEKLQKEKQSIDSEKTQKYLATYIIPAYEETLIILNNLQEVFQHELKEDQRILVADIFGASVGVMVDRMQQVIRVPENIIDPPPKLLNHEKSDNLQGIVKLQDGLRLILLLDEKHLFDEKLLKSIQDLSNTSEEEISDDTENKGEKTLQHDEVQMVTFKLDKEEFGLYISDVREINRLEGITRVPNAPSFVEGILNLRGSVIPAIDLRKRFNLESIQHNESTRVIIVDIENKTTGLIVDSVSDVIRISKNIIEDPPEILSSNVETRFIAGVGNLDKEGRFIMILDVDKIFDEEEKEELQKQ
ncbi:MAG: chemotaxis protein CheW [Leptospiraceae bacterium]|nr:chemotaxis protein CheW [Leptospiraceae bacterium]